MLENYNLETKHYVILAVLGVVEFVLFALMFYNCFLELRQKRRQRKYHQAKTKDDEESVEVDVEKARPSVMEIFSVDMTLNRDTDLERIKTIIPYRHSYYHEQLKAHRPSRHSL